MIGKSFNTTKRITPILERFGEILSRNAAVDPGRPEGVWLESADLLFLFRITARTLDHWKKDGILHPLHFRGRNYFSFTDIYTLILTSRNQGSSPGKEMGASEGEEGRQEETLTVRNNEGEEEVNFIHFVLLDPNDLCAYMKISSRTEFRWRKKLVLPHIKIRGRIYYSLADIRAMLENCKQSFEVKSDLGTAPHLASP